MEDKGTLTNSYQAIPSSDRERDLDQTFNPDSFLTMKKPEPISFADVEAGGSEIEGGLGEDPDEKEEVGEEDNEKEEVEPSNSRFRRLTFVLENENTLEYTLVIIGAMFLSFNSGFVNGCTLMYKDIPVSHITGTTTHAALRLAKGEVENLFRSILLVFCFIFGAAVTGSMVPNGNFQAGLEYGKLFYIASMLFLLACIITYYAPDSELYFYCAAIASGIQNAMTLKYNGSIIRTSHVTGLGTDIGLVAGRAFSGDRHELWKLQVLGPIFIAFFTGGVVSVFVYDYLGRMSLLLNVMVFFLIGTVYTIVISKQYHLSIYRTLVAYIEERKINKLKKIEIPSGENKKKKRVTIQIPRSESIDCEAQTSPFVQSTSTRYYYQANGSSPLSSPSPISEKRSHTVSM